MRHGHCIPRGSDAWCILYVANVIFCSRARVSTMVELCVQLIENRSIYVHVGISKVLFPYWMWTFKCSFFLKKIVHPIVFRINLSKKKKTKYYSTLNHHHNSMVAVDFKSIDQLSNYYNCIKTFSIYGA